MKLLLAAAVFMVSRQESLEEIRKNLDVFLKRWAEEYVTYIMTDEEQKVFGSLTASAEKLAFIDSFWRRRDPTPATPENEFREEYAKRYLYANAQFRTARPGWRTDRGRMYLLMGPPTYVDRNPLGRSSMERPSEVWTYMNLHHPDLPSSLEIRFVDFFGNGDYEIASSLDAANISPTGFLPSYSDLDYFGQRRAYPLEMTDAGPRRVDEGSIASERFNFLQDLRSAEGPPEARPQPLSAIVGATVTFDLLPFDLDAHTLYDPAGGTGKVPVALTIRYDNLRPQASAGRLRFSIDVYAELRDELGKAVDKLDRQLNFELAREEIRSQALRYLFLLQAPPATYHLQFLVRDNFGKSVGIQEVTTTVPGGTPALSLSSLILADAVQRIEATERVEPFTFTDVQVVPNPARVFRRGDPMFVYFQAYGLGLKDGKNSLRVEYGFLRSGQLLWKPTQVSLFPTDRTDRGIYSSFDTTQFPPGRYTLAVALDDLARGETVRGEASFIVQ